MNAQRLWKKLGDHLFSAMQETLKDSLGQRKPANGIDYSEFYDKLLLRRKGPKSVIIDKAYRGNALTTFFDDMMNGRAEGGKCELWINMESGSTYNKKGVYSDQLSLHILLKTLSLHDTVKASVAYYIEKHKEDLQKEFPAAVFFHRGDDTPENLLF